MLPTGEDLAGTDTAEWRRNLGEQVPRALRTPHDGDLVPAWRRHASPSAQRAGTIRLGSRSLRSAMVGTMSATTDLYKVLQVDQEAERDVIRAAYGSEVVVASAQAHGSALG